MIQHKFRALLLPPLVMLVMLGVVWLYWWHAEGQAQQKRQNAFAAQALLTASSIETRLHSYELLLRGVKGFIDGAREVDRDRFATYVAALDLSRSQLGLQGVSLLQYVTPTDKARHQARLRQQGMPEYQIRPTGQRAAYAPITLLEPATPANRNAIGFDVMTVATERNAMERSRDNNALAITNKMHLVQDSGPDAPPAVVMYLPIYQNGANLGTLAARRQALIGWVDVPFRIADLIASLSNQINADLNLAIFDGETLTAEHLLFDSGNQGHAPVFNGASASLRSTQTIHIGGHRWSLVVHALPAFDQRFNDDGHQQAAWFGVALSLLLGGLTWLLATERERAAAMVRNMTQKLRDTRDDLQATLNAIPDLVFESDEEGRLLHVMAACPNVRKAAAELLLGKQVSDVLTAQNYQTYQLAVQEARLKGICRGYEFEVNTGRGKRWYEVSLARKEVSEGAPARYIWLSRDITERKQTERQLRLSDKVFHSSRDGIVITDARNNIIAVNPAFTALTGYSADEAVGQTPSVLKSGLHDDAFYRMLWQNLTEHGFWEDEIFNRRKDGSIYPQWLRISCIKNEAGEVSNYVALQSDLSAVKAAQTHIDYLAHYDSLTRLPNRVLLQDRANQALASAARTAESVSLMFIDLDRFKNINDSLGQAVGDCILQTLAQRLQQHLHSQDTLCRHGGDEFILLLPDTDVHGSVTVAKRLLTLIAEPIVLDACHGNASQQLRLTASIGVALFPDNADDFEKLSQCADAAMFRAKQDGRNTYHFFAEQIHRQVTDALRIENDLHRAVAENEFCLYYQPQVQASSGRIIGAEALIRWQHPQKGLVSPAQFIPVAEDSGQINQIGLWVLQTATQQSIQWQREGLVMVPVAVNLSALQFRQTSLCDTVAQALGASGLPSHMLELELTERIAMEDSSFAINQISLLHALGVQLSLDDFGTGYSSLSYLRRYKIDKLKIDQSFVRDLGCNSGSEAIVRAVIDLAHNMGFKTIAEGVETQAQLDFLCAQGCDEIQGYYFSKPVPANDFAKLLAAAETIS